MHSAARQHTLLSIFLSFNVLFDCYYSHGLEPALINIIHIYSLSFSHLFAIYHLVEVL